MTTLQGYAIRWNKLSADLGGFRERFAPGAIDRTLREGIDLRALRQHDPARLLGRLSTGTLRVRKDTDGLAVEIDLPSTADGDDVEKLSRRGDLDEMSFEFSTLKDHWEIENGEVVRTVRDARVSEVSVVTIAAYPGHAVDLRADAVSGPIERGLAARQALRDMAHGSRAVAPRAREIRRRGLVTRRRSASIFAGGRTVASTRSCANTRRNAPDSE